MGVNTQKGWDVVLDFFSQDKLFLNKFIVISLVLLIKINRKINMIMFLIQQ